MTQLSDTEGESIGGRNGSTAEYYEGSIVRIKLHNFMTYHDCEFYPGPRLNLVIGPNGTGKSSVVCAICLGLGGEPNHLGRSSLVSRFVRRGENRGTIEIELYREAGNVTVTRIIYVKSKSSNKDSDKDADKERGTSEWRINGQVKTQKHVKELLKGMHIQVGNLCQMLPQDRVGDFSKKDEAGLLEETARSVYGEFYDNSISELLKCHDENHAKQKLFNKKQAQLENETAKNSNLEKRVEKLQERENLLNQLDIHEKLEPWLRFERFRYEALGLKDMKGKCQEELKKSESELEPLRKLIRTAKNEVEKVKTDRKRILKSFKVANNKTLKAASQLESGTEGLEKLYTNLGTLEDQKQTIEDQVVKFGNDVAAAEDALSKMPSKEELDGLVKNARSVLDPLNKKKADIQSAKKNVSIELTDVQRELKTIDRSLERFQGVEQKKLKLLEKLRYSREAIRLYQYVQKNKGDFRGKVHGPLLLEIQIAEDVDAACIEAVMPSSSFTTYVTENEADRNMLMKVKGCNVMNVDPSTIAQVQRSFDLGELSKYGIKAYGDELVNSSPVVKEALRRLFGLHKMLIGNVDTEEAVMKKQLLKTLSKMSQDNGQKGAVTLITPRSIYKSKISSYSGETVTSTSQLDPKNGKGEHRARLLRGGVDDGDEEKAELLQTRKELQGQYEDLKQKLGVFNTRYADIEAQAREADKTLTEANKQKNTRSKVLSMLKTNKSKLARAEKERNKDFDKEAKNLREKIAEKNEKTANHVRVLVDNVKDKVSSCKEHILKNLQLSTASSVVRARQYQMKEESYRTEKLKEQLEEIHEKLGRKTKEAKKAKKEAENIAPMDTYKAQFEQIGINDHDVLCNAIEMLKNQISECHSNPALIEEFNQRRELIEKLGPEVEALKVEVGDSTTSLDRKKIAFESPMQKVVDDINMRFKAHFQSIYDSGFKCVGEVHFLKDDEDPRKYGIGVRVKFRENQKMQQLSADIHSGGERSLTTFLYLLSLQELAQSPFRVVDEINQGMDAEKERLAFGRLIKESCTKKSPQYFLITPKLLRGLKYDENITINFVFNGPHCVTQEKWNKYHLSKRPSFKNHSMPSSKRIKV